MKSTGIVRRIDDLGRVVIPKEIRKSLLIEEGDPMEIFIKDDGLFLKKYLTDYSFYERLEDIERRFNTATDMIGHKNSREIKKKFEEIKKLWVDTDINKY